MRAYVEGSDDPQADLADQETVLPTVTVGEALDCRELESKSHTTAPPSRFTEATLTRALEEKGIGRPSTYAMIIETIQAREYVVKRGNALVPTWVAFAVSNLLESHLPELVDYRFTAQMEDDLDAISRGESGHVDYLRNFYFGNGQAGLKKLLEHKVDEIDARDVSRIALGTPTTGDSTEPVFVRVGRYGPFIEQGERRAGVPEGLAPDELSLAKALELLEQAAQGDEPLGVCPETNKPVYLKVGRFGPYVQRGTPEDDEKPQNASLLKGMRPRTSTWNWPSSCFRFRALGRSSRDGAADCGLQRSVWALRQVGRRNTLVAGRVISAGRDPGTGTASVSSTETDSARLWRGARAGEKIRRVASDQATRATFRGTLRTVRDRRRNECLDPEGSGG